jgi:hypothetical protein
MADEATPTPTTTDSTPANVAPVSPAVALWAEVAGAATTKGTAVRQIVIDELTNTEIIKRKEAVLSLLTKYEEKTKELKKQEKTLAKNEFDGDGKVSRTWYDAEGIKALKALRDEIAAISEALNKFFNDNDTKKLYELAKK